MYTSHVLGCSSRICPVSIKLPLEDNPYRLIIRKRRIHTFGWCGHSTTIREGSLTICKTLTSLAKTLINLQQYEYKIHAHAISSDLVISCLKVTFILKNHVGTFYSNRPIISPSPSASPSLSVSLPPRLTVSPSLSASLPVRPTARLAALCVPAYASPLPEDIVGQTIQLAVSLLKNGRLYRTLPFEWITSDRHLSPFPPAIGSPCLAGGADEAWVRSDGLVWSGLLV